MEPSGESRLAAIAPGRTRCPASASADSGPAGAGRVPPAPHRVPIVAGSILPAAQIEQLANGVEADEPVVGVHVDLLDSGRGHVQELVDERACERLDMLAMVLREEMKMPPQLGRAYRFEHLAKLH